MKVTLEARTGRIQPYLLLLPALAILIGFLLFPLIWNMYLALHDVSLTTILGNWKYVGVKNFDNLIHDQDFHTSLKVSLIFVGRFGRSSVFCWNGPCSSIESTN